MNKNNQQPGKKLSRNEMKSLKGGAVLPPQCTQDSDCVNACTGNMLQGYICLKRVCRFVNCA
jgi:natural product precursor